MSPYLYIEVARRGFEGICPVDIVFINISHQRVLRQGDSIKTDQLQPLKLTGAIKVSGVDQYMTPYT